jgi:hypothetical protein
MVGDVETTVSGGDSALAGHNGSAPEDSRDEPMDAIVHEIHPAFLPHDYPYGPKTATLPRPTSDPLSDLPDFSGVLPWLGHAADHYFAALQRPPDFVVPKTFGMSAILGIMTALAMLFACLRWMDAWPVYYFFFSALALVICLAQMFYGKTPRLASIVAGAIMLPLFSLGALLFDDDANPAFICLLIGFIPFGALMGYLTGTCAAGVFLVMDILEPYLQGRGLTRRNEPSAL